ncbi:hypothetical protein HDU89_008978 [Geranomyces variabilis]|nr:hypothetical protein HDU89_008978 [Geranomyces variabilis]
MGISGWQAAQAVPGSAHCTANLVGCDWDLGLYRARVSYPGGVDSLDYPFALDVQDDPHGYPEACRPAPTPTSLPTPNPTSATHAATTSVGTGTATTSRLLRITKTRRRPPVQCLCTSRDYNSRERSS